MNHQIKNKTNKCNNLIQVQGIMNQTPMSSNTNHCRSKFWDWSKNTDTLCYGINRINNTNLIGLAWHQTLIQDPCKHYLDILQPNLFMIASNHLQRKKKYIPRWVHRLKLYIILIFKNVVPYWQLHHGFNNLLKISLYRPVIFFHVSRRCINKHDKQRSGGVFVMEMHTIMQ